MSTRMQTQTRAAPTPSFTPTQSGLLQRKCACGGTPGLTGHCEDCRKKRLTSQRRSEDQAEPSTVLPIVQEVLRSPGQPLDADTRAFMEPRFGHNFSQVRVHADTSAAGSAEGVRARAYTVGQHVVFGEGQPSPQTIAGRRLLAHELAHVVQQSRGGPVPALTPSAPHERDARAAAMAVATGEPGIRVMSSTGVGLAREEALSTNPLQFPKEVVEMPWTGVKGKSTKMGYLRDLRFFWRQYAGPPKSPTAWAVHLSPDNRALISSGVSPVVNDTWIKYHPQHAPYKGEKLIHHHIGQGSRTVAIPETLHRAHNVMHQQLQTVGTPTEKTKKLDPVPPDRTKTNVREHSKKGPGGKPAKIRGPGISGKTPPPIGEIPPSSGMAGMPPEKLGPVSATEKADIARVDPATGKVRDPGHLTAPGSAAPPSTAANPIAPASKQGAAPETLKDAPPPAPPQQKHTPAASAAPPVASTPSSTGTPSLSQTDWAQKPLAEMQRQIQRGAEFNQRLRLYISALGGLFSALSFLQAIKTGLTTFTYGTALPEGEREASSVQQQSEEARDWVKSIEGEFTLVNVYEVSREGNDALLVALGEAYGNYSKTHRPYVNDFKKMSADLKATSKDLTLEGWKIKLHVRTTMSGRRLESASSAGQELTADAMLRISNKLGVATANYAEAAERLEFFVGLADQHSRVAYILSVLPNNELVLHAVDELAARGLFQER